MQSNLEQDCRPRYLFAEIEAFMYEQKHQSVIIQAKRMKHHYSASQIGR
jgi:hypothetical protein